MTSVMKARITMYSPAQMFGFARNLSTGQDVFFHLGDFRWISGMPRPPPVVGEWVEVEFDPSKQVGDKPPKASRVTRLAQPEFLGGTVDQFDVDRGYGFITADDGKSYYLHRSDVDEGGIPVKGERVEFFAGFKRGKPRACYITIGVRR